MIAKHFRKITPLWMSDWVQDTSETYHKNQTRFKLHTINHQKNRMFWKKTCVHLCLSIFNSTTAKTFDYLINSTKLNETVSNKAKGRISKRVLQKMLQDF